MVSQVQRAAAGALRTLAFKNEDNKNQIVECGALPTLIHMLRAEDSGIHYEAVGVIGNLVHSSQVGFGALRTKTSFQCHMTLLASQGYSKLRGSASLPEYSSSQIRQPRSGKLLKGC